MKRANEMSIKEFMDYHFRNLKITNKLANDIYRFRLGFITNNESHIEFFGSTLLGVHRVHFKDNDFNRFMRGILQVDPDEIVADYPSAPFIVPEYKVAGDVLNISLFYMMHRFLSTTKVSDRVKDRAAHDLALIFNYRTIAALVSSKRFKYLADEDVAKATYESLSGRFILKKTGSWMGYMEYRANALLDPKKSKHIQALTSMSSDKAFINAITDSQGRVRDTVKIIYRKYLMVKEEAAGASSSSMVGSIGDKEVVNDVTHGVGRVIDSVISRSLSASEFKHDGAMNVLVSIGVLHNKRLFKEVITSISKYSLGKGHTVVADLIREILVFQYGYITSRNLDNTQRNDITVLVRLLKGIVMSSKSTDPKLIAIKDGSLDLIEKVSKRKDVQVLVKLRNSFILYIFLLAYVHNK